MLFGTKKNLLTLVVLSIAVIGMYMKSFFLYLSEKEKYVPEPKSLFIVTDAVNGYGLDLTTIIAKENFHVLGVVRTLDDAEFLRSSGLGKVDTLVWTNEPHVTNDTFSLARNELIASLASYNALNISVSGIVVTLTPQHFYDKAGPSEMDGFEFSIETVKEVLTSIAMIQQVSREFNSKSMRIVLVAPYAPSTFLTDPRSLNSTEIAEMVIMRSLEAAVHEVRSHLASEGFSVSILYSPSRHTPSETFWQVL